VADDKHLSQCSSNCNSVAHRQFDCALWQTDCTVASLRRLMACSSRITLTPKPVRQMVLTSAALCRYNSNEYLTASGSRFNYAAEAATKSGNFVGRRRMRGRQTTTTAVNALRRRIFRQTNGASVASALDRAGPGRRDEICDQRSLPRNSGSHRSAADPTWINRSDRAMSLM